MKITIVLDLITLTLSYTAPTWASLIAGAFVLITLSLSMYLVFEHLSAYKNPEEQKFLIGVILMVPCYAVESVSLFDWLSKLIIFPYEPRFSYKGFFRQVSATPLSWLTLKFATFLNSKKKKVCFTG